MFSVCLESTVTHQSQNVLIVGFDDDKLDDVSVAKLADFGTAREDTRISDETHASTRQIVGTSPYVPPEYLRRGQVSERTDAFALGVLIVELLVSEGYDIDDVATGRQDVRVTCEDARVLVDDHMGDADALRAAIECLSSKCAGSSWASSGAAKRAAAALTEVAINCVKGPASRSTPDDVLPQLEAVGADARALVSGLLFSLSARNLDSL